MGTDYVVTDKLSSILQACSQGQLWNGRLNVKAPKAQQWSLYFHLVILDVILPGQSGFELCHTLKTNNETKQIPVVICSSKGTEVDSFTSG